MGQLNRKFTPATSPGPHNPFPHPAGRGTQRPPLLQIYSEDSFEAIFYSWVCDRRTTLHGLPRPWGLYFQQQDLASKRGIVSLLPTYAPRELNIQSHGGGPVWQARIPEGNPSQECPGIEGRIGLCPPRGSWQPLRSVLLANKAKTFGLGITRDFLRHLPSITKRLQPGINVSDQSTVVGGSLPLEEPRSSSIPPTDVSGCSLPAVEEGLARLVLEHSYCRPVEPADVRPEVRVLPEVRVVFFDLYGTLLLGVRKEPFPAVGPEADSALAQVIRDAGLQPTGPLHGVSELLAELIAASQETLRRSGVDYPEVEICTIWRNLLEELCRQGKLALREITFSLLRRLALHWEMIRNPVWPAPGLQESLKELENRGYKLGLISNSQFYSRTVWAVLLGRPLEESGFEPKLVFLSYEHGCAKPGTRLYELAANALAEMGLSRQQALHVGNDLLQDVVPAQKVGFHTALLAQDRYNLRLTEEGQDAPPVKPDVTLTTLSQLLHCLPGCTK